MDKLVALCKRRGFIFPSSEIYGGINGFWDYGPLGVELKRNIKEAWWHDMVTCPPDGPDGKEIAIVGVDCSLIMNPRVWQASGHLSEGFADPMVDCRKCRGRFRADKVWLVGFVDGQVEGAQQPAMVSGVEADSEHEALEAVQISKSKAKKLPKDARKVALSLDRGRGEGWPTVCPSCGEAELTEPRAFNLMFKTYVGALEESSSVAYLRPETAQGIFVNFNNVVDTQRVRIPFGIAQVGKAFRNEINPRNYTFRSREFEQMELEFFCHPDTSREWYEFWRDQRLKWYTDLWIRSDKLRPREQGVDERAHYSVGTTDVEYLFPFSDEPQELEGVAHRADYDLNAHQTASGKDMLYFDDETKERYLPHVIEPSAGVDRFALATLCEAYHEQEIVGAKGTAEARIFMRFHPRLAPIKAAVFPLVKRDGMPETAQAIYRDIRREFKAFYDEKGAIGRRYARQDEAGTPFCFTVDGQTAQDGTVTVRWRDTLQQERIDKSRCLAYLREKLSAGGMA
ncbi:MAG: glycine--tRNA ligase [Phycisphaerae bacterium]|nr:glycine--tRNA ligase [Phycisphaerae bacterium]